MVTSMMLSDTHNYNRSTFADDCPVIYVAVITYIVLAKYTYTYNHFGPHEIFPLSIQGEIQSRWELIRIII